MNYKEDISFGFEQTFTIKEWWKDPGFVSVSDTPLKREKILDLAVELAKILDGKVKKSKDIYGNVQYEVHDHTHIIQYWVTLDPGSIEVKTPPLSYYEVPASFDNLFQAAFACNLYPYREWWYGIKGGTEGGTHINMGGKTLEENIFYQNPALVLKYIAFIHNNPCFHYPFMGPDVGPEGNAMRIDEQPNNEKTFIALNDLISKHNTGQEITIESFENCLKNTSLYLEKCSMPSLYKFKAPLYLLEDRAQEAFRSTDEVLLMLELKIIILNYLQNESKIELKELKDQLHNENLSYEKLWAEFQIQTKKLNINTEDYKVFFERQFPLLVAGGHSSDYVEIREGRRPRVITDKKFNNGICVSKTIDTRHKRFEFKIVDSTLKVIVKMPDGTNINFDNENWAYKDIILDDTKSKIEVHVLDLKGETVERVFFDMKNMMWD